MILDIDPKVDYAFKHLFGRDSTRSILIDLLDQVLNPGPGHHIQEVELLNPFNPKESLDDKLSILDIKARDQSGRQINVEMQMLLSSFFKNRIIYYLTKFHQQQLHEGEDYSVLKPTISIVFLNQVLFPEVADYHLRFRLLEEQHHFPFAGDLELHTLELPKFRKTDAELTSGLDIWLYFLRHAEKIDPEALPKTLDRPLILRAMEELKMLTQTDIERERYEARRKAQLDHNSDIKAARMEGEAEGETKGLIKGKIGEIHLCERLLRRSETPAEQLQSLSLEELTRLAEDLQVQLLSQR
jgi:predicted transposase/invertase (TIGR01784 family)